MSLRKDNEDHQSQRQLLQEVHADLHEGILALSVELRRANVEAILRRSYTFSTAQQKAILADTTKLDKFIELDYKINNGLLKIKTTSTRYIASILFTKTLDQLLKLTFD